MGLMKPDSGNRAVAGDASSAISRGGGKKANLDLKQGLGIVPVPDFLNWRIRNP
jgi:hypothetical protein